MASDGFLRGEPEFTEILIQKANQYADQAAGLQSCGGEQREQTNTRIARHLAKLKSRAGAHAASRCGP
jgi:hypothetical protein